MTEETPTINDPAAVLEALERAKADAKKFREEAESLRTQLDNQEVSPWRQVALNASITSKLQAKGIKDPARLAGYVVTKDLDLDEEGNIAGLDESIESLSKDFPELFDVKRQVGGKADHFRETPVDTNKSATDRQLDSLFN